MALTFPVRERVIHSHRSLCHRTSSPGYRHQAADGCLMRGARSAMQANRGRRRTREQRDKRKSRLGSQAGKLLTTASHAFAQEDIHTQAGDRRRSYDSMRDTARSLSRSRNGISTPVQKLAHTHTHRLMLRNQRTHTSGAAVPGFIRRLICCFVSRGSHKITWSIGSGRKRRVGMRGGERSTHGKRIRMHSRST